MNTSSAVALTSNSNLRTFTNGGFIIPSGNDIMSLVGEVKASLWQMGSEIRGLLEELQRPLLHSGRTDSIWGHYDTEADEYHFHHGEPPHQHPNGICPYFESYSLIQTLRGYAGIKLSTEKPLDGRSAPLFKAEIPFGTDGKVFTLEIEGNVGGFYIYTNEVRKFEAEFFEGKLRPLKIAYAESPWQDENGGVDYKVNASYLHELIRDCTKEIEPLKIFAKACTTTNGGGNYGDFAEMNREANAIYIYNYLTCEGWSKEAICGLLGNAEQESRLNPGEWEVWNNPKNGYGIVQWTPDPVNAPEKFLQENHLSVEEVNYLADSSMASNRKLLMDMQLEYLINELRYKGEWLPSAKFTDRHYAAVDLEDKSLKYMSLAEYKASTGSVRDLALVFHASYERSSDSDPSNESGYERLKNRIAYAEKWLGKIDEYLAKQHSDEEKSEV